MMERFGYTVIVAIACTTVAVAIYTGMKYQELFNPPEPCITNLSTFSYPMFEFEQVMLDKDVRYKFDSDFYREGIYTSTQLAELIVELSQDSEYPSSIYTNDQNGRKFYVPALCYVGKTDFFGDPILYRK